MITRTINKPHFDDLDATRFEMLVMNMVYRMRRWEHIEHFGAAGSDDGIDIQAVEVLENGKEVTHHYQCKRYEKITAADLKKIVIDYCKNNTDRPDYYYIVCGCSVSKKANDSFLKECSKNNFKTAIIWTASNLEAMLYADYHDLLFTFFGINLSDEYNNRVTAIRRNIALKKRMYKGFQKTDMLKTEDPHKISKEPWRKFRKSDMLIRSIYDKSYPEVDESDKYKTGWYKAEVFDWYHNGLMVFAFPYSVDAIVKIEKSLAIVDPENPDNYETVEIRLWKIGCIPFENIIDYDLDGDEFYRFPHLYCDFINGFDPYEKIVYYDEQNHRIDEKQILEIRYS